MRVNLIPEPTNQFRPEQGTIPLSLTIRPACGLPGDYQYPTDSAALMRLLRQQTDLPGTVLQQFENNVQPLDRAHGCELSDSVLTRIGYFID